MSDDGGEIVLLWTFAVGRPEAPAPVVPVGLRPLVVVYGDGREIGDFGLTDHGRAALRAAGHTIGSVFDDARILQLTLEVAATRDAVLLCHELQWGVQRVVAAGDVLVLRAAAVWNHSEPAKHWRSARLVAPGRVG